MIEKIESLLRDVDLPKDKRALLEEGILECKQMEKKLSDDVIQHELAEKELGESIARYKLFMRYVADIISVYDVNLELKYVSDSVETLRGYSVAEAMQETLDRVLTPDSLTLIQKTFAEEMELERAGSADPKRKRILELQQYCKNGAVIWVEVTLSYIRNEKGGATGIISVTRDIAERKKAEDEKVRLERQLLQSQKMQAIGTLAGGIAHDFNNLLMCIQGSSNLARIKIESDHPAVDYLESIEKSVTSAADLTKQLLGFARGGKYEVKTTNMNGLLMDSASMFGRTKKEISIFENLQDDSWNIEVDRGQIGQVLLNLFVNAWHAMPHGGSLHLETRNVILGNELMLPVSVKPGKYVKVSITDTGAGMDEKTKARIFEPFFTTKEMGRGTGLGLAAVYGIIKNHHGMINVYSELGHGTTFTIYLPASESEMKKEDVESKAIIPKGKEIILIIDDEEIVLNVGMAMLSNLGYIVHAAKNGEEALALYREKKEEIDLIILDMIMPRMLGGEVFDSLRAINPGVKVLLSSGYSINGDAQSIIKRGCKGFIQKPYAIDEISREIRKILDK